MNNAIVCLTRGYEHLNQYDKLLKRNESIYKFFGSKYPIIIFHEGNINQLHQQYINGHSPFYHDIKFVDVSEVWNRDKHHNDGNYKKMCQFNAYYLWEYCKEYDYILRVDEDCILTKVENDPFDPLELINNNIVCLTAQFWDECHTETNNTLPLAIEILTGADRKDFYNHKFPYTNLGINKVSFWREGKVAEVLKKLALSKEQGDNRWGDLPLLGSLLNIYAPGRTGDLKINYFHESHNKEVINIK